MKYTDYIAHVRKRDDGTWDEPQSLEDHLEGTAKLAAQFAEIFDSSDWAYLLGWGHDPAKGKDLWQDHIRTSSGYDEDASSETLPGRVLHAAPSAKLIEELFPLSFARPLSYCIAGHHTGLPDWRGAQASLQYRLEEAKTNGIPEDIKKKLPPCPKDFPRRLDPNGLDASLWIRKLFSCLVDADRLDTERYMNPEKYAERQGYCSLAELHNRFNAHMDTLTKEIPTGANADVHRARQQVLEDCKKAALLEPGFFSLTVPTGGGKTLSSMAFALAHAKKYQKNRIIYVIPYTSIIEQNTKVFKEVFGKEDVLEHHSNLDPKDDTERARLAAENWDAPIIVTTTVQFFESLFAAHAGKCRKLHNIVNSVVILDEAQLLPVEFLHPIIETMFLMIKHYRVSFVICTATKPIFEKQDRFPDFPGLPQGTIREIINDVPGLHKILKRVAIEMPKDNEPVEWKDLAGKLSAQDQVLCIVSDRTSCRELHALMPKGTYHLSALMCAEHRTNVIAEIKKKLEMRENVRVISTQLVEAGVDIDFPTVYRAMAGFDSIAQSAGRCNREGRLNKEGRLGRVVVFNAPRQAPRGILRQAAAVAQNIHKDGLNGHPVDDFLSPDLFIEYFSRLYWRAKTLDKAEIIKLLKPDRQNLGIQFREAADLFKIIDDKNQQSLLVPYGDGEELIKLLKDGRIPERSLLRKLQRYTINIYKYQFDDLWNRGSLEEIIPGIFALICKVEYSNEIGLLVAELPSNPETYMA
jgi:CRISPR-associated endonuclease/helicase Cas3